MSTWVSVALVAASLLLFRQKASGVRLVFSAPVWTLAVAGGILVLASFVIDFESVLRQVMPPPFHWGLFAVGFGFGLAALGLGLTNMSGSVQSRESPGDARRQGAV